MAVKEKIANKTLKPITKVKSQIDRELHEKTAEMIRAHEDGIPSWVANI
jgi:hypothetical protein